MDSITTLIKAEIKRQYKSVRQFSEKSGIPYSTLSNCLSKGIGGTAYDTVVKICNLLNLKQIYDADLIIFNDQFFDIWHMLSELDEQGIHTIKTVLTIEHNRCSTIGNKEMVKAFNGVSFARKEIQNSEGNDNEC